MNISEGKTKTEKRLAKICEKTFLKLWSYPNVYLKKNVELCDLLVICNHHIIIFSDKEVCFTNAKDISIAWKRWFNKAIKKSINQLKRAEIWVKDNPEKIYLDAKCENTIPIPAPEINNSEFHLIAVTNGINQCCKEFYNGSNGSLVFSYDETDGNKPFNVGDENKEGTFVHILDEFTLVALLRGV